MNRFQLCLLTIGLTMAGLVLFFYKAFVLNFPLIPEARSHVWNVEASVSFVARNEPVKMSLHLPDNSRWFAIVDENFVSRGYGLATIRTKQYGNRKAAWSKRKARGYQSLFYRCVVRRGYLTEPAGPSSPPDVEYPQFEGAPLAAAESVIAEIQEQSADVDTLVAELINRLNKSQPGGNLALLLGKEPTLLKKMEIGAGVLAHASIPARVVQGIRLERQNRNAPLIQWLEVYDGKLWKPYDPVTGRPDIPDDYLAWWRGRAPVGQLNGGDRLKIQLAVGINQEAAITAAIERGEFANPLLMTFSLFSLPIRTQAVYRVLLLVPVGAFLLVVFRNVIGVKTFGTFMPILIALAFRETRLIWGIALFSSLVGLGLAIRFQLERLKLLLVPRLASVLIVVVLLMAALSILTHKLGLERGVSVALFPMVILTMTIERMSIVWEEQGRSEALQQALGSLLVAALAYLIMTVSYVEHLVFVFPELLFLLLAGTLLMGRYTGYRLLELFRFKALIKQNP
ncbi:MAG: hypothetical protein AMK69_11315 [Nitrospira bacterium SG8_3]|nr:MAG: hypothetical protein AMK69_11315 [Nitrospira bacterium SG8_3]